MSNKVLKVNVPFLSKSFETKYFSIVDAFTKADVQLAQLNDDIDNHMGKLDKEIDALVSRQNTLAKLQEQISTVKDNFSKLLGK